MNIVWPDAKLTDWVKNACASLSWEGDSQVPVSITFPIREKDTSYIFSPRSAWFDYLAHECRHRPIVANLIKALGKLSHFLGIDKTIFVGNYPISTSIWTTEQEADLISIAIRAKESNPDYYVGIRNLLPHRHPALIIQLKALGFYGIPSRVIYEFNPRDEIAQLPSHMKRDLALLKRLELNVQLCQSLDQHSLIRIHQLYQRIYLYKHSLLNPQYTVQFFADLINKGTMTCLLLRSADDRIRSFALLLLTGNILTVPALGYDSEIDLEGSYRALFAAIYTYAKNHGVLLNYSSGAGDFKRKRGGTPYLEYTYLSAPQNSNFLQKNIMSFIATKASAINTQDLIALGA